MSYYFSKVLDATMDEAYEKVSEALKTEGSIVEKILKKLHDRSLWANAWQTSYIIV